MIEKIKQAPLKWSNKFNIIDIKITYDLWLLMALNYHYFCQWTSWPLRKLYLSFYISIHDIIRSLLNNIWSSSLMFLSLYLIIPSFDLFWSCLRDYDHQLLTLILKIGIKAPLYHYFTHIMAPLSMNLLAPSLFSAEITIWTLLTRAPGKNPDSISGLNPNPTARESKL